MEPQITPVISMLEEFHTSCPYCGEAISLLVDQSGGDQDYIEDCQVCCRPIGVRVSLSGGHLDVALTHENDA